MKNDLGTKLTVWSALIVFSLIVFVKFIAMGKAEDIFSSMSQAVFLTFLGQSIFVKWAWKWKIFKWSEKFHNVPNLEGTWTGTYQSSGNEKTPPDKLNGKANVTVTQSDLYTIKVTRESDESRSKFISGDVSVEDEFYCLTYTYLNETNANVRERSPISYGTARLKVKRSDLTKLEGNYWTDQNTTGFMSLSKTDKP